MVKGVGEPRRGAATGRVAASYRAVAGIGAVALVGALLTGAPAAAAAPVGTLNPATSTASAGESSDSEAAAKRLADRIRATLGSRAGQVSVVVHDRKSGTTVTHNGSLRVETASIVKVMILVAVIDHRRANGSGLTSSDRALARKMIRVSDNAAASTLLGRAGGKPALDRLAKRLGMKHTATSWSWGLTRTSAADQVRLVDAILDGKALPRDSDRDYVLGLMGDVVEEQAWGSAPCRRRRVHRSRTAGCRAAPPGGGSTASATSPAPGGTTPWRCCRPEGARWAPGSPRSTASARSSSPG